MVGKLSSDVIRQVKCIQRVRTHKCGIRVPTMMSGKARYEEGAVYRDVAKPSTTLLALTTASENPDNTMPRKYTAHCLTECVDRLHRSHLVFWCLLTAGDCSAISPCTTTVRPHEPSSRHARRLHVMLTADLQSIQPI